MTLQALDAAADGSGFDETDAVDQALALPLLPLPGLGGGLDGGAHPCHEPEEAAGSPGCSLLLLRLTYNL